MGGRSPLSFAALSRHGVSLSLRCPPINPWAQSEAAQSTSDGCMPLIRLHGPHACEPPCTSAHGHPSTARHPGLLQPPPRPSHGWCDALRRHPRARWQATSKVGELRAIILQRRGVAPISLTTLTITLTIRHIIITRGKVTVSPIAPRRSAGRMAPISLSTGSRWHRLPHPPPGFAVALG